MKNLFTNPTMDIRCFETESIVTVVSGTGNQGNLNPTPDQMSAVQDKIEVSADILGFTFTE